MAPAICLNVYTLNHLFSVQGQVHASGALWGLSIHLENRLIIVEHADVIRTLNEVLETMVPSKVLNYCALAIQNLAAADVNKVQLVSELGVIQPLMSLVRREAGIATEASLVTLKLLAQQVENRKQMVRKQQLTSRMNIC